ncbi:MAG: glucose 1-dehydrogenase [Anaerolineae bacterium]|nr:glucose 1-dehydrogenase [Anaerolineae bacterium]
MPVLSKFDMHNKVALITGGSRGLGKVMAETLAEAGASVVVCSRNAGSVHAVATQLETTYGRPCRGYMCDVTDEDQVMTLVANVIAEFGQVDVLINNAGINIRGPIDNLSLAEFLQVQAINVTGVWLMCRAVAPHMKARHYGRVINIGSMLSVISMPERTPYATSKGAVLQLTRTLALEWAPHNITVNAVLPGPFATEMNKPLLDDPEKYQAFVSQIPLGRWGELDEIGGLTLFLASDASSFVTGAGIAIDGGWTVR